MLRDVNKLHLEHQRSLQAEKSVLIENVIRWTNGDMEEKFQEEEDFLQRKIRNFQLSILQTMMKMKFPQLFLL